MNMITAIFCVILFSLTIPCTRIAALEMSPLLIVGIRLSGAGIFCALLMWKEGWLPPRKIWLRLVLPSIGAVLGFSLLIAKAMQEVPGTHGAVALAALPALTAVYSSLRDRHNPGWVFWVFALLGTLACVTFFFNLGVATLLMGDFLLLLAVLVAAFGYVEGGRLSREHGGTRVMSWAIILVLPFALVLLLSQELSPQQYSINAWVSMAYLALVSQTLAMFLWFKVLAVGPMEKVAMVQLLQPFFSLLAAVYLLQEWVSWQAWGVAVLVVLCILGATFSKNQQSITVEESKKLQALS